MLDSKRTLDRQNDLPMHATFWRPRRPTPAMLFTGGLRRRLDIARRVLFGLEAAKRGNQEMIPAAERIKELLGPLEATND